MRADDRIRAVVPLPPAFPLKVRLAIVARQRHPWQTPLLRLHVCIALLQSCLGGRCPCVARTTQVVFTGVTQWLSYGSSCIVHRLIHARAGASGIVSAKDCTFQKNQCGWNAGGAVAFLQSGSRSDASGGKFVAESCVFQDNGDNYGFKYSGAPSFSLFSWKQAPDNRIVCAGVRWEELGGGADGLPFEFGPMRRPDPWYSHVRGRRTIAGLCTSVGGRRMQVTAPV